MTCSSSQRSPPIVTRSALCSRAAPRHLLKAARSSWRRCRPTSGGRPTNGRSRWRSAKWRIRTVHQIPGRGAPCLHQRQDLRQEMLAGSCGAERSDAPMVAWSRMYVGRTPTIRRWRHTNADNSQVRSCRRYPDRHLSLNMRRASRAATRASLAASSARPPCIASATFIICSRSC